MYQWQTNKLYVMLFKQGLKNIWVSIFNEKEGTTDHILVKDKNDFKHYWNYKHYKMIIH